MQNRGDILFRFSKFSSVPPRCCWAEKIRLPKVSVPPGEVLVIFLYYLYKPQFNWPRSTEMEIKPTRRLVNVRSCKMFQPHS